jgi:hypothetical protein
MQAREHVIPAYQCPRCGYETRCKKNMRKHLYGLKKSCCSLLSIHIKQYVLRNRIYHIPGQVAVQKVDENNQIVIKCTGQASVCQSNQSQASTSQGIQPQASIQVYQRQSQVLEISDIVEQIQALRHDFNQQIDKQNRHINKLQQEVRLLRSFMKKRNEKFYQNIVEKHLNGKHKKVETGITDVTNDTTHAEIKQWSMFKFLVGQLQAYNHSDPKDELHAYFFGIATKEIKQMAYALCINHKIKVFTFIDSDEQIDIIDYATKDVVFSYSIPDE